jgi:hypothetical protein
VARKEYHEPSVAAWEEYHQPTTRWWRRRQPQVAGPGRSGVTRGARSVIATGGPRRHTKLVKKGEAEEHDGMGRRGKSTINQQANGGGRGDHKSSAQAEVE